MFLKATYLLSQRPALPTAYDNDTERLHEILNRQKNEISSQHAEIGALTEKLASSQNIQKMMKEQFAEKHINELRVAEQNQQQSERRIIELHKSLNHAQSNMQGCLRRLEESAQSPANISKTVVLTEARAFQSRAEEGQAAFDNMKAEMDLLFSNLHSRENHVKELEEIIDNLQTSLEKSQQQLLQVQTNADMYRKERDRAYRKEEEARQRIAKLQSELQNTAMEKQKSWQELRALGSRSISFAPRHTDYIEYEKMFEKEQVASDEMKVEMQSLLRDLQERDGEIAAQAQTIVKLQAELTSTQRTLKELQRKEVASLGEGSRGQQESDSKILELEGALNAARADLSLSQDRLTTLEIERRTRGVSFKSAAPEKRADPSNEWQALEKARAEISTISQKLEARKQHIKKQDEVINALEAALDQALSEVSKLQVTPDPSADRARRDNKERIELMKAAIRVSEYEFNQSRERLETLEHTLSSPKKYSKTSNRPMMSNMNEFRFNTVEAQAAVEDIMEEMESLMKNMNSREKQISELEKMISSLQHTLAQYEQEMMRLKENTEAIAREKRTSELNLKDREEKIQQLQEALNSTQLNMKRSFEKLQASKQQADAQEYQAVATEGQLAMEKMADEMKKFIRAVKSRENQLSQKEEIIKDLQRSLEQTKNDMGAVQKKASTYLKEKENAEQSRKESERKLEKLQAELASAQDELRQKVEQFSSYEVESEVQIKPRIGTDRDSDSALACARQQIQSLEDKIKVYELQISERPSKKSCVQSLRSVVHDVVDYHGKDEEANKAISKLKAEIDELVAELEQHENKNGAQEKTIGLLQQQLAKAQRDSQNLQHTIDTYAKNLDQIMEDQNGLQTLQNRFTSLETDLKRTQQQVASQEKTIQLQRKTISDLETSLDHQPMSDNSDTLQEEVKKLLNSLQQCKTEAEDKTQTIKSLEDELSTLRNNLKQSKTDTESSRQDIQFAEERGKLGVKSIVDEDCVAKLREKDKQIDDLDKEINNLRSSLKRAKMELADLKENLEMAQERSHSGGTHPDVKTKLFEKDEKIEALEAESNEFRKSLKTSQLELSDLREELKMAEKMRIKFEGARNENEARIEHLEAELNSLRNTVKNCKSELEVKDNKIGALETELNSLNQSLHHSKQALSTIKAEFNEERERMSEMSGKDAELKQSLNVRTRQMDSLKHELDLARDAEHNYKKEIDRLKQDLKAVENHMNLQPGSDNEMYMGLKKHLEEKNQQIENQEEEMNLLRNTMANYKEEIGELKRALTKTAEKDIPQLQRQLEASQEHLLSKGEAVNYLQGALDTTQDELHKLQLEIERMLRERGESETAIRGLQSEVDKSKRDAQQAKEMMATIEQQQKELDNYHQQLEKLQDELNRANAEIQALQSTLKAKEKLLADQEEMGAIQKDTIKRSQDEFNKIKEKLEMEMRIKNSQDDLQKQVKNQQVTIGNLQQALLGTKQQLEELQGRGSFDLYIRDRAIEILYADLVELESQYKHCYDEVIKQEMSLERSQDTNVDLKVERCHLIQDVNLLEAQLTEARRSLGYCKNQLEAAKKDCEKEKDDLKDKIRSLEANLRDKEADLRKIEDSNRQKDRFRNEVQGALQDQIDTLQAENNNLLGEVQRLQDLDDEISDLESINEQLILDMEDLNAELDELKQKHDGTLAQNKRMLGDLQNMGKLKRNYGEALRRNEENEQAIADLTDEVKNYTHALDLNNVQLEAKQKEADDMRNMMETLEASQGVLEDLIQNKEDENKSLQNQLERLKNEKQAQDAVNKNLTQMVKEDRNKAEKAERGYHKAMENAQRNQAALVDAANREAQLIEEFANKEKDVLDKLREATSEAQQLSNAVDMLNREVENLQAELTDRERHLLATEADLESLAQSLQKLQADVNSRNEAIKKLKENEKQHKRELEETNATLDNVLAENDKLRSQLSNMSHRLQNELENMRQEIDAQEAEKANLSALLEDAQRNINKLDKSYHKAMENSQKNEINAANREAELKEDFANKERDLLDQLQGADSEVERLSKAVVKRNEAIKKLKTNENVLASRLGEMEAALQDQAAEADNLRVQRAKMQHHMQTEIDSLKDQVQTLGSENGELLGMLKNAENEAKQSEMNYRQAMENSQRNQDALIEAVKRETQLQQEFTDKERELLDQLQYANLEVQKLSDAVVNNKGAVKELKANEKQLLSQIGDLEAALETQSNEVAHLSKLHLRMKCELESLKTDNRRLNSENVNLVRILKDAENEAKSSELGYHNAMENSQRNQDALVEAANREVELERDFAEKEKNLLEQLGEANCNATRLADDVLNKKAAVKELKANEKQLLSQIGDLEATLQTQATEVARLSKLYHRMKCELESYKTENQRLDSENVNLARMLNNAENEAKNSELGYCNAMENSQRNQDALVEAANREMELERDFAEKEKNLLEQLGEANCNVTRLTDDVLNKKAAFKELKVNEKQLLSQIGDLEASLQIQATEVARLSKLHHQMKCELESLKTENRRLNSENVNLVRILKDAENEAKSSELGYHNAMENSQRNQDALVEAANREVELERDIAEKEKNLLEQLGEANCNAIWLADDVVNKKAAVKELKANEKQLLSQIGDLEAALQTQATEVARLSKLYHRMKCELESLKTENQRLDSENVNLARMLNDAENEAKNSELGYHNAMENSQRNQDALVEAANREVELERDFAEKEKNLLEQLGEANCNATRLTNDVLNKTDMIKQLKATGKHLAGQLGEKEESLLNQSAEIASLKCQLSNIQHCMRTELKSLKNESLTLDSANADLAEMLKQAEKEAKESEMGYHEAMEISQSNQQALIEAANREARLERMYGEKEKTLLLQLQEANCNLERMTEDLHTRKETLKKMRLREDQLANQLQQKDAEVDDLKSQLDQMQQRLLQEQDSSADQLTSVLQESAKLKSDIASLMHLQDKTNAEKAALAQQICKLKQTASDYQHKLELSQQQLHQLLADQSSLKQIQMCLEDKIQAIESENLNLSLNLDEVKKATVVLEYKNASAQEELDQLLAKQETLDQAKEKLEESNSKLESRISMLSQQLCMVNQDYQQQLNESLANETSLRELNTELESKNLRLSQHLHNVQQVAKDMKCKCSSAKEDLNRLSAHQEALEQANTALQDRNATIESEKLMLTQQLCELSRDYQQQLNDTLANVTSLQEIKNELQLENTRLESELAFMRDAFRDLQCNFVNTTNSVENLKYKLTEANMSRKDEVKDLCMESRCLVNNVRQWINQQISDNTKLCNLIKVKSAVNKKLSINLQNLFIKYKGLEQQNAKLKHSLESLQDCPRDNAPMPSCFDWPDQSKGRTTSSTVSITHYYQTEQESSSPDDTMLSPDLPELPPCKNRSVTWATTMTQFVQEPNCQRTRKRQVRSLTRS